MPGTLAKTKNPSRSISRHKLHRQFAQLHSRSVKSPIQQFSRHGAVARLCATALIGYTPYPQIFIRLSQLANGSLTNRRNPARRSRNVREPSSKKSDEMSRLVPHNFPAIARQRQKQYRRTSAQMARETTRDMARNNPAAAVSPSAQQTIQHPAKHPVRRLVKVLASRFQP